jgi:hypothetical protein
MMALLLKPAATTGLCHRILPESRLLTNERTEDG